MDVDDEEIELPTSSSGKGEKKRFEVKKVIINLWLLYVTNFIINDLGVAQKAIHMFLAVRIRNIEYLHVCLALFYSGMLLLYGRGVSYAEYRMHILFCGRMFVMSYTEINSWRYFTARP